MLRFGKDSALARLREGIRRLNDSHGVPNSDTRGYHETITVNYVRLIDEFLSRIPENATVEDVLKRLLSSRLTERSFLLSFYSKDVLMSPLARREYVQPDLRLVALSPVRVSRSSERVRSQWKNGGGWTEEVAIFPDGASLDNFEWRVSIAGTTQGGPFSIFPGIERTLVLLEGQISLSIDGREPVQLTPESLPLSFSGDVRTSSALHSSALVDLNVMTRRGRFHHSVERCVLEPDSRIALGTGITIVIYVVTRDAWIFEQPSGSHTTGLFGGDCYVIRIDRT